MRGDAEIQRIREAIRRDRARPPAERFEEMVRLGLIDREGHVLVPMRGNDEEKPKPDPTANGS